MSSRNRAKGISRWEAPVVQYLRAWGLPARRAAQEGRYDVGDLHGLEPFIGQAKNWADTVAALRVGVDGAEEQAQRAGADYGVAFVKRARASVARGYAVLTIRTFARVLLRLRRAEDLLSRHAPDAYADHITAVASEARDPEA